MSVPDNCFELGSKWFERLDKIDSHPFDHVLEKFAEWERNEFPEYFSGLMRQEKRESVKHRRTKELLGEKLVLRCFSAACFVNKKKKKAENKSVIGGVGVGVDVDALESFSSDRE